MRRLKETLDSYGIENYAYIKLNDGIITRRHKLIRRGFDVSKDLYAVIFAVPYLTESREKNISAYAAPRDYHLYFKELFAALIPSLCDAYPNFSFLGSADDSPIDERQAALIGGLGILGENGLVITEKHSSYVFLGEIITDMPLDTVEFSPQGCLGCGRCKQICPKNECGACLSALTQKKGALTEKEADSIKKFGSVWGCDLCQEVCPYTERAKNAGTIYTNIEFFKENILPRLSPSLIDSMSDEDFNERAYSWRGRDTIRRNLLLFENKARTQK